MATAHLCSGALMSGEHLILASVCFFLYSLNTPLSGSMLLGGQDNICLPDIRYHAAPVNAK